MLSVKRILSLAEKYGPNVRFFPESSEGTESNEDENLDKTIKDEENAARTPEEQSAIDKSRLTEQQLEQEKANTARANETARQSQADLETARTENTTLKEQLEEAETKAAKAGIRDVELDESKYEGTDLELVRAIKTLNQKVDAKDKEIDSLNKKADGYEEQGRQEKTKSERNAAYEDILTDLDGEYGADCRNEAVKKFKEMCDKGEVPKGNTAKATRALEKCYKEAKAGKTTKKKESLSLDTGSGGGNAPSLSGAEIPSGLSLDEAVDHLAAASHK